MFRLMGTYREKKPAPTSSRVGADPPSTIKLEVAFPEAGQETRNLSTYHFNPDAVYFDGIGQGRIAFALLQSGAIKRSKFPAVFQLPLGPQALDPANGLGFIHLKMKKIQFLLTTSENCVAQ
ncbi:MAG: hypothetical protein ACLFRG_03900 [Desulfococcaceae bacterium]